VYRNTHTPVTVNSCELCKSFCIHDRSMGRGREVRGGGGRGDDSLILQCAGIVSQDASFAEIPVKKTSFMFAVGFHNF
jgi:hypothetical protein